MTPDEGAETIGARLRRLRLEGGLSQRELAAPGVSYAYISRIEAGTRQPSVKALRKLAAKLGVTAAYLETGSDMSDVEARELRLADVELSLRLGTADDAEPQLEEILEEAIAAGDTAAAARARTTLGFSAYERGDYQRAISLFGQAIAEHRPLSADAVDVYCTLGNAYRGAGSADQAVALWQGCLDEVSDPESGDVTAEVRYAALLSYALTDAGEIGEAESVVKLALDRAREHGTDPYMRVRLYWSLARLSEMEGKSSAALHNMRRAIALLEATDDTLHLGRAHLACAFIMTSQRNAEPALTHLKQAEKLFGPSPLPDDLAMLKVEHARAEAVLGNGASATKLGREAIELLGGRNPAELGLAYAALADGLALEGKIDEANDAFRQAVDLLEGQRRWREAAQTCQSWGRMLRKSGREQEALDVLERAAELSLRLMPITATPGR